MRLFRPLLALLLLVHASLHAQESPIGYWTSHFPYHVATSVASDGQTLYVATDLAFFTYTPSSGDIETYSKVNGMSDVEIAWIGFDRSTGTAIITYRNGNIDLFKNKTFYNIPYFKQRVINGPKTISGIYTENGLAYLSTSIGVIVVNVEKKEIKETWEFAQNQITIPVLSFTAGSGYYYATTTSGVYRISRTSPSPQVFNLWQKISDRVLGTSATVRDKSFMANLDSVFVVNHDTLQGIFSLGSGGEHLDEGNGKLLICNWSALQIMNPETYTIDGASFHKDTKQAAALDDWSFWAADSWLGLGRHDPAPGYVVPEGPYGKSSFDIYAYDRNILVAHGAVTDKWLRTYNADGLSEFKDGQWKTYRQGTYAPFGDSMNEIITVTKDRATGTIYAGSFAYGLSEIKADGSYALYGNNSPVDLSPITGGYSISSLALDANGTLWMTPFGNNTNTDLYAKTPGNTWMKYNVPFNLVFPDAGAGLLIDDLGQKWYYAPSGSGVIVYNDNGTPDMAGDDTYRQLMTGAGAGNLPNNDVYCLAKDKNNAIWIGTRAGIGIVNCADVVTTERCDAERPIVQFDQFAGYLFETEVVYAIAVDGANRKWVGTANGIWLLSPNGEQIVYRFTAENSPLPSNLIRKISIDPVTGDVYIGTDKGLVCYRSTATDGGEQNDEQLVTFPNPVPSGYSGTIAIKGFVENADVRITDISGQLVYRTTALGGQAVWNGLDYKGRRPQSGVYLVFATNRDGTERTTGKIVFMQ